MKFNLYFLAGLVLFTIMVIAGYAAEGSGLLMGLGYGIAAVPELYGIIKMFRERSRKKGNGDSR